MRIFYLIASRLLGFAAILLVVGKMFIDPSDTSNFPFFTVAIVLFVLGCVCGYFEQKLFLREPIRYRSMNPDDPDWNP